ncbi:MAG: hypothetical protein FVQ81_17965 [Candidatus Glassbacteria bacterium]|nr:hypothetical protein [Candidatus Glassbacteria bacterium]
MPSPPADYVLQSCHKIDELLREAGGGEIDREIDGLIGEIEKLHGQLSDINARREWTRYRHELVNTGRKLHGKIPGEIWKFQRARNQIRKYPGTGRQVSMLDRVLTRLSVVRGDPDRSLGVLSRSDLPSAGFNTTELDPALSGQMFTLYHPGESGIGPAPFRFTGPADSEVTIEMEHVRNLDYGGHGHGIEPEHLGTFEDMNSVGFRKVSAGEVSFRLRDGSQTQVWYQPSDVCTRRRFKITHTWPGESLCYELYVDLRYAQKLYDLYQYDLPYMHLYTGDEKHPSEVSHYGTEELVKKLVQLNSEFGTAYEAGEFDETVTKNDPYSVTFQRPENNQIWVNDMSLPWGGLFKIEGLMERKGKHANHRWGNSVDISINTEHGITTSQVNWLRSNGPRIFGVPLLDEGNHFHFQLE